MSLTCIGTYVHIVESKTQHKCGQREITSCGIRCCEEIIADELTGSSLERQNWGLLPPPVFWAYGVVVFRVTYLVMG